MVKYKQKLIPLTSLFADDKKLSDQIKDYYKTNLQGKFVVNEDTGITIVFTSDGLGKAISNRRIGKYNAAAMKVINQMLKVAEYSNFGERKPTDKKDIIGYLNFKAKVKIDGQIMYFRIAVKLRNDMKAYYNHTVNRFIGDGIK